MHVHMFICTLYAKPACVCIYPFWAILLGRRVWTAEERRKSTAKASQAHAFSLASTVYLPGCVTMFVCVSGCLIIMLNTLLVIVLRCHQGQGGQAVAKETFTHVSWMQTTNVRPKQTKRFVCRLFILLPGQLLKHSCSIQHLFVRSHSVGSFVRPSLCQSLATGMFWIAKLGQGVWPKIHAAVFFSSRHVLRLPICICILIWPWFGFNFISICDNI